MSKTVTHVVRSRYNYDQRANSKASAISFDLPSLAVQDQKEDADINTIVKRYGITGKIPVLPVPPEFVQADFNGDYHSAMNLIASAHEAFDAQPSHIREEFDNNPQKMLDFLNNPDNIDQAVKLGLVNSKPVVDVSSTTGAQAEAKPLESGTLPT